MGKSTVLVSNLPAVFGEDLLSERIRGKLQELIQVMLHSELDLVSPVERIRIQELVSSR